MKKTLIIMIIVVVVVAVAAFYGGMKYATSKQFSLSAAARQRFGAFGNRPNGANIVNGQIISINGQNMTVQLRDGSSKIVFYSTTTEVSKFVTGTLSDLVQGANVMIGGTTNSDGSLTATSIQIRPNIPNAVMPGNASSTPPLQPVK